MKIELSREDVETILKKYFDMDALMLNNDGSAIIDTTLEKIITDKKTPVIYDADDDMNAYVVHGKDTMGKRKINDFLNKVGASK